MHNAYNISALNLGASNFSIRYEIYQSPQCTIDEWCCLFTYASKTNYSRDLFADQYIPIVRLEMTSKLRAHSSSSINMVVINQK